MKDVIGISRSQPVTKGMNDAREEIFDRSNADHVFGDVRWSSPENACDLANSFVLSRL